MSDRKHQKVLWADEAFYAKLEEIKARRLLAGRPVKNLGQLTKEMLSLKTFRQLEEELTKAENCFNARINIRFDGRI